MNLIPVHTIESLWFCDRAAYDIAICELFQDPIVRQEAMHMLSEVEHKPLDHGITACELEKYLAIIAARDGYLFDDFGSIIKKPGTEAIETEGRNSRSEANGLPKL